MKEYEKHRVLGIGNYEARWIAKSLLVELTATGILPCFNYEAQLEKRPERIDPPMWNMIFIVDDVCQTAIKPFSKRVVMANTNGAKNLIVRDALGEHEVPIKPAFPISESSEVKDTAADRDEFIVYAKLPKLDDRHHGCIVVPADALVTGIHYKAFGPTTKKQCEKFVAAECTVKPVDPVEIQQLGGEIPWPFLDDE